MEDSFKKILKGYQQFRKKYASDDSSIMQYLSYYGQQPKIMVVACCDSRVDPALILQCDPGDLFIVRNVANIIPPFEKDEAHHGTSAALEFGIRFLQVEHLILLGHSQCGGIQALINSNSNKQDDDFITNWVSLINKPQHKLQDPEEYTKLALTQSYENSLTFPWVYEKVKKEELTIHQWFFDIKTAQIFTYSSSSKSYQPLDVGNI